MQTRAKEKLFANEGGYGKFAGLMKTYEDDPNAFKVDFAKSANNAEGSQWPLKSWPIPRMPLQGEDNSEQKCAKLLTKRLAEKLLFSITDLEDDQTEDADDTRDIADVMAGVPSSSAGLTKFYNSAFRAVEVGLNGLAKSFEIAQKCNGAEFAWEVSFSENFKVESNLSADFNSLRQLGDYAFTKSNLTTVGNS